MVDPVPARDDQVAYWTARNAGVPVASVAIGGPEEAPDVTPCPALIGRQIVPGVPLTVHVAYELNEIELVHLATGGTLWLTTWGGLPIHKLEVIPRGADPSL